MSDSNRQPVPRRVKIVWAFIAAAAVALTVAAWMDGQGML